MSFLINLLRTRHRGAGFREGPSALNSCEVQSAFAGVASGQLALPNLDGLDHDQRKRFVTHFSFEWIWTFRFELIPKH